MRKIKSESYHIYPTGLVVLRGEASSLLRPRCDSGGLRRRRRGGQQEGGESPLEVVVGGADSEGLNIV